MNLLGFELRARRIRPKMEPPGRPTLPAHPRQPGARETFERAPDPIALARAAAAEPPQPRGLAKVGRVVAAAALASPRGTAQEPLGEPPGAGSTQVALAPGEGLGEPQEPAAARSFAPGGGGGYGGDPVLSAMTAEWYSEQDLLGLPAVEAAISLISGTLASLPALVMEPDADGILQPRPDHPISRLLAAPSRYLTAYEWKERIVADTATDGNGLALITRDGRGVPAELRYVPASWAFPERAPRSGLVFYRISDADSGQSFIMAEEDVLHIRYRLDPRDRLHGISPVRLGSRTLRLATASENFAAAIFRNRGVPGAVVTTAKAVQPKGRENLRAQILAFFSGSNAGRAIVLEEGSTFTLTGHNLKDSQLVETSESLVAAVGRLFGVPPALLGQSGELNYSAMREVISAWTRLGLRQWLVRVESAFEDKLLSEDAKARGVCIRFQTEELTRLDDSDRARFYQSVVGAGVMTPNEARRRERLAPREDGNELRRMPGEQPGGRPEGSRRTETGDPTPGSAPGGEG